MSPKTVIIALDTVTFAKALADETRQKIMAMCCCNEMSVSQLVEATNVAQPTVSHHLKILKEAGLVTVDRRGKETFYTLNQAKLAKGCCQVAENFAPEVTLKIEI
jgi:ArsR family transcriptional regulator